MALALQSSLPVDELTGLLLADPGAEGPLHDWLIDVANRQRPDEDADLCLLYARDREACDGLWDCIRCPVCRKTTEPGPLMTVPRLVEPSILECECGKQSVGAEPMHCSLRLLDVPFTHAAFWAWAAERFGEKVGRQIVGCILRSCTPPNVVTTRELKRRLLGLIPLPLPIGTITLEPAAIPRTSAEREAFRRAWRDRYTGPGIAHRYGNYHERGAPLVPARPFLQAASSDAVRTAITEAIRTSFLSIVDDLTPPSVNP